MWDFIVVFVQICCELWEGNNLWRICFDDLDCLFWVKIVACHWCCFVHICCYKLWEENNFWKNCSSSLLLFPALDAWMHDLHCFVYCENCGMSSLLFLSKSFANSGKKLQAFERFSWAHCCFSSLMHAWSSVLTIEIVGYCNCFMWKSVCKL